MGPLVVVFALFATPVCEGMDLDIRALSNAKACRGSRDDVPHATARDLSLRLSDASIAPGQETRTTLTIRNRSSRRVRLDVTCSWEFAFAIVDGSHELRCTGGGCGGPWTTIVLPPRGQARLYVAVNPMRFEKSCEQRAVAPGRYRLRAQIGDLGEARGWLRVTDSSRTPP